MGQNSLAGDGALGLSSAMDTHEREPIAAARIPHPRVHSTGQTQRLSDFL
jgi:hypothetical protein